MDRETTLVEQSVSQVPQIADSSAYDETLEGTAFALDESSVANFEIELDQEDETP